MASEKAYDKATGDEVRRASLVESINLNKNLDAK